MIHQIMCTSYLSEVAHDVCQESIGNNLFVSFTIAKVNSHTFDPPKPHPKWEPLNSIEVIDCDLRYL